MMMAHPTCSELLIYPLIKFLSTLVYHNNPISVNVSITNSNPIMIGTSGMTA
jgi:hypothetical protein